MEDHKKQKATMEADRAEQKRKVSLILRLRYSKCTKSYVLCRI